ncbi:CHAP domain-containing protein [Actinophytocola oryzae]|uniref:CHAP domain-containing protein n=1 Tax=Actinophytocola oryzae TaxID=502181 RepID=A0A4R7W0N0_9PSEU|nr:CHAP domain-containing protein [Actinophytocola oryzae]TDV56076.1 CHAP domain-containing protein [Actinophytocola oryzae]
MPSPTLRRPYLAAAATVAGVASVLLPTAAQAATAATADAHVGTAGPEAAPRAVQASLGDTIAQKAVAELSSGHIGESPAGSNCNYYSGYFGRPCEEWCADFGQYVWKAGGANVGGLSAASASFAAYGRAHGTWHAEPNLAGVKPGDAVLYNLNGSGTYASHVGIVTSINNGTVNVVSGNYHNTVYKHPAQEAGTISGYVHPVA